MNIIYQALCNEQKRIIIDGENNNIQEDLRDLDDIFKLAIAKEKIRACT